MEKRQRTRTSKFTADESHLLVELIERYKDVIESKQTNKISQRDKKICWEKITYLFNIASKRHRRRINELKLKWDNLKKLTRKKFAQKKLYERNTGDGPSNSIEFTADELKILNLVKLSSEYLPPQCNSDNRTEDQEPDIVLENSYNIEIPEIEEISNETDHEYKTSCIKEEVEGDTFFHLKAENGEDEREITYANVDDVPLISHSPHSQMPKKKREEFEEFVVGKKDIARLQATYYLKKSKILEDNNSSKQRRLEELHEQQMAVLRAKKRYYEEKTKQLQERKGL